MAEYTVLGQEERTTLVHGRMMPEEFVRITFEDLLTHVIGTVMVPKRDYPDAVQPAIMDYINKLRQVHAGS